MAALLDAVLRDHERKYGRIPGGAVAVVALGKAGSREMMAGSDLDLMLIYGHAPDATESDGASKLPVSTWFIRAAHAFVAALTAPGVDGPLYAADMRLRPSGSKGPVAVSLEAFRRYHAQDAWTWERMTLTRARVVASDCPAGVMTRVVEEAIAAALAHAHPPAQTKADAAQMRARLLREHPPTGPWDVKLRAGGMIDVEFIAQTLLLVSGVPPGLQHTADALAHLASTGRHSGRRGQEPDPSRPSLAHHPEHAAHSGRPHDRRPAGHRHRAAAEGDRQCAAAAASRQRP